MAAPEELAALDLAITELNRSGSSIEARTLTRLKDKILSLVPRKSMARIETDHEALLDAQGIVARPGPRPKINEEAAGAIVEAIKGCRILELDYRSRRDDAPKTRRVAAYGILSGVRRYLVGRPVDERDGPIRTYRLDGVVGVRVTDNSFVRPDGSIFKHSPTAPLVFTRRTTNKAT
jgi:predicted DNA-binding transcriptional regulator YafY